MNGCVAQQPTREQTLRFFPETVRGALAALPELVWQTMEEVRLRVGQPLMLRVGGDDVLVGRGRGVSSTANDPLVVTAEDVLRVALLVTGSSLYAVEDEIRNGFVTVGGGHRVGIAGKVVLDNGRIKTIKNVSAINFRLSREIRGAADAVLPYLLDGKRIRHTLIVSPPRCGKTTLLRDLVRQVSSGVPGLGFRGVTVGVVDERSEIAGCYKGVPQRDVGPRTDVLDACPKAEGMMLLVRAFSPDVLVTDEIGRYEDVSAIEEAMNAGVTVVATAHARSLDELARRPVLRSVIELGVFERYVILDNQQGPGTLRQVVDGRALRTLPEVRHA